MTPRPDESLAQVLDRFQYHPPVDPKVAVAHVAMREAFRELAAIVHSGTVPGRHRSLALTALQEASMWTQASIAIDGLPSP